MTTKRQLNSLAKKVFGKSAHIYVHHNTLRGWSIEVWTQHSDQGFGNQNLKYGEGEPPMTKKDAFDGMSICLRSLNDWRESWGISKGRAE